MERSYLFEHLFKRITGEDYGKRASGLPSVNLEQFVTDKHVTTSIESLNQDKIPTLWFYMPIGYEVENRSYLLDIPNERFRLEMQKKDFIASKLHGSHFFRYPLNEIPMGTKVDLLPWEAHPIQLGLELQAEQISNTLKSYVQASK